MSGGRRRRPNVLWVCTDSQRWDTLGCYGNPHVRTPNADRLAAEGVRFENAFAQSPLCTPSRGCFLTGRYPVTNRLRQNGQVCPADLAPVTRLLADDGYVCGLAGKLHLSPCDNRLHLGPEWFREDRRLWFTGQEPRALAGGDGYSVFHWDHAPTGEYPASDYTRWLVGHGYPREPGPYRDDCRYVRHGRPTGQHQATWCADRAVEFVTALADAPYPWLFSVNVFDPHYEFDPPDDYLAPYLDRLDALPPPNWTEGELDDKPAHQRRRHVGGGKYPWPEMSERDHRMLRAAYFAMCDHVDAQVGRLLGALEATGQREDTLVVLTSDHGEMLGDHGLYTKGPFLYDPALSVPLIVSWPGVIPGGRTVSGLVELCDLAPTLLEAADGVRHAGMQGRSLWPLLTGEQDEGAVCRDDVYAEYLNANPDKPAVYLSMVRTARQKLVRVHGTDEGELYDLDADPTETRNLWADPGAASLKTQMLLRLTDRQARTCDPLPERIGVF